MSSSAGTKLRLDAEASTGGDEADDDARQRRHDLDRRLLHLRLGRRVYEL
ncbi:MAG: hypothetical protein U0599_17060 [Vicinamibacteria bacterium]